MSRPATRHDLKVAIGSHHPIVVVETVEERRATRLLAAVARDLQLPLFEWSVTTGLRRAAGGAAIHGTSDAAGVLRHLATLSVEALFVLYDLTPLPDNASLRRLLREVAQRFSSSRATLCLMGPSAGLPEELEPAALYFSLPLPDRTELARAAQLALEALRQRARFEVEAGALDRIAAALSGLTLAQARRLVTAAVLEDGLLDDADVADLAARKAELLGADSVLEYIHLEDSSSEVGGLQGLKRWLERAQLGFSSRAKELNLQPPRGILLAGVQGCGKSLAARRVAHVWQQPLVRLDPGRLYDRYVGQSESNLRRALETVDAMAPVVLWIDEIEKGFAAGSSEADGGLSRRLLGTFLTWMQERRGQVFLVATANHLDLLPAELLRKGRFDETFFVDLPAPEARLEILTIHLRRRRQDPARFQLSALVERTDGFSGAELEQMVVGALYQSLEDETDLTQQQLEAEAATLVPLSVSRREQIEGLRRFAGGRFVSAN